MTEYMQKKQEEMKAEMDKVKAMTEEERKAYMESKKDEERIDPISDMVKSGIITQTQADKIKEAMPAHMQKGDMKFFKVEMDLTKLVESKVIDQATADKMTEYMQKKHEEMKADMEKVKAMTEEERKEYFESKKVKVKLDILSDMVDNGVITQTQADAIKAVKNK